MKISTKARYAVMALCDLAQYLKSGSDKKPVSLQEISQSQELPVAYLEQIFMKLKQAKLVDSIRGASGGYVLARPANMIRVSDIIYAVEKPAKTTRCDAHTSKGCHSSGTRCLTHDLWEELGQVIHLFFSKITLQDILDRKILGSFASPNNTMSPHVL